MVRARRPRTEQESQEEIKTGSQEERTRDLSKHPSAEDACLPCPKFIILISLTQAMFWFWGFFFRNELGEDVWDYCNDCPKINEDDCTVDYGTIAFVPQLRGEVWRVITHSYCATGLVHLLTNVSAQLLFGCQLEMELKSRPVAIIYLAGMMAAPLFACAQNDPTIGCGASTGVAALEFAFLVHLKAADQKKHGGKLRSALIVFSLFYVALSIFYDIFNLFFRSSILEPLTNKQEVDYIGHLIGDLAGVLVGLTVTPRTPTWLKKFISCSVIGLGTIMMIMTIRQDPAPNLLVMQDIQDCREEQASRIENSETPPTAR